MPAQSHIRASATGEAADGVAGGFRVERFFLLALFNEGTYDVCEILLPDSGHLQEEDAERS